MPFKGKRGWRERGDYVYVTFTEQLRSQNDEPIIPYNCGHSTAAVVAKHYNIMSECHWNDCDWPDERIRRSLQGLPRIGTQTKYTTFYRTIRTSHGAGIVCENRREVTAAIVLHYRYAPQDPCRTRDCARYGSDGFASAQPNENQ